MWWKGSEEGSKRVQNQSTRERNGAKRSEAVGINFLIAFTFGKQLEIHLKKYFTAGKMALKLGCFVEERCQIKLKTGSTWPKKKHRQSSMVFAFAKKFRKPTTTRMQCATPLNTPADWWWPESWAVHGFGSSSGLKQETSRWLTDNKQNSAWVKHNNMFLKTF